jgi:hypothetical protein
VGAAEARSPTEVRVCFNRKHVYVCTRVACIRVL